MKAVACDSVFLTGNEPGERDFRRVLVLGGDRTGFQLACRLSEHQFKVLLVGEVENNASDSNITVIPDATLDEIQGFAGDFQIVLRTPSERRKESVGAIIAAQPPRVKPKFEAYGIQAESRIISLSELELKLQTGEPLPESRGDWYHAAFLFGLEGESDPQTFARILAAIEKLRSADQVQCHVFTRNLKVAADGLERRYRECRESGTLFFKFDDEGPVFERVPDGLTMVFKEPLLGMEMELTPDLVVVDEDFLPPQGLEPLWAALPSAPACVPYLQPESPRFSSVETPKSGILALGASRGIFSPESVDSDIEVILSCLKRLEIPGSNAKAPGPPKIDPDKCAICLTCVRLCPHGAMGFTRYAFADPVSCMRCGICAAACPMSAIKLEPSSEEQEISQRIRTKAQGQAGKKTAIFVCSHSGAQAASYIADQIDDSVALIEVPCAGTVDVAHILAAFREGAKGVIVTGCFKGNCASVYGTSLAEEKAHEAAALLAQIGISAEQVMFVQMAGNTPDALLTALKRIEGKIAP